MKPITIRTIEQDRRSELKQELQEILDRRFAHRDFSILSRKWKGICIEQIANLLLNMMELEITRAVMIETGEYESLINERGTHNASITKD